MIWEVTAPALAIWSRSDVQPRPIPARRMKTCIPAYYWLCLFLLSSMLRSLSHRLHVLCVCVCVCVCQPWSQWDHWNTILGDNGLLLQDHKTQLSNLTTELESVFFRAKKTKTTNPVHLSPRHPRELSSVFPCTHFLRANSCFCMLNTEESITWQVFCFFFSVFFSGYTTLCLSC